MGGRCSKQVKRGRKRVRKGRKLVLGVENGLEGVVGVENGLKWLKGESQMSKLGWKGPKMGGRC